MSTLSAGSLGTSYANPDVDRLLTLARSTADPFGRLELCRRAAREVLADKPVLPLFEFADHRLVNARVAWLQRSSDVHVRRVEAVDEMSGESAPGPAEPRARWSVRTRIALACVCCAVIPLFAYATYTYAKTARHAP